MNKNEQQGQKADIRTGKYQHYKGNFYEVLSLATHSETLEVMVVYRALYGVKDVWVRPAFMWNELVVTPDGEMKRFKYVGELDE